MNKYYSFLFFVCSLCIFIFLSSADARRLTPEEAAAPYPTTAPFTTTDGVAGGGLVPHAHLAGVPHWPYHEEDMEFIRKPQFGMWYIGLPKGDLNWFNFGGNVSVFDRLELGFAFNSVNIDEPASVAVDQLGLDLDNNVVALSGKLMLVKEKKWIPAISVGAIYKHTDFDNLDLFKQEGEKMYSNNDGVDFFAVASKTFFIPIPNMDLPLPLFVNAGIKSTKGQQLGVVGFGSERDEVFFGSTALLLPLDVIFPFVHKKSGIFILGFEYVDDIDVGMNSLGPMKTKRMWDVHLVYDTCKDLSFILAYLNTGSNNLQESVRNNLNPSGLGDGIALSMQYQF